MRNAFVLVVATGKGGAGKSTLVRSLASEWHVRGKRVGIVDADPKHRIKRRHNPEGLLKAVEVVAEASEQKIKAEIDRLVAKNDIVIVDTAGSDNQTNIVACMNADMVLIPLKPAPDDADDAIAMYELIAAMNKTPERKSKPIESAFVLTMAQKNTVIVRRLRKQFSRTKLNFLPVQIGNRISYLKAAVKGLGPAITEPNSDAAFEIRQLSKQIDKIRNIDHGEI